MRKQALVIGLGQFGMALVETLASSGVEVIAVDQREDRAHLAEEYGRALCLDATDPELLMELQPRSRDLCVCSIGSDAREGAIICTALLREQGAPYIAARAADALHARILRLVGAHEVLYPERDVVQSYAYRLLHHEQIDSEVAIGGGLYMTKVRVPRRHDGKSLAELQLPARYQVQLVALQEKDSGAIHRLAPDSVLHEGDKVYAVGSRKQIMRAFEIRGV